MFFRYKFLSIFAIAGIFSFVSPMNVHASKALIQSEVIEITAENFEQQVLRAELPVVLDVYAVWCSPCQMMKPIFEELAVQFKGRLKFVKMNGDLQADLANELNVESYPSFIFFDQGDNLGTLQGSGSKEDFTKILQEFLIALAEEKTLSEKL